MGIIYKDSKENYSDLVSFGSNKYQAVHRWYPLVEGFSSELVRRIIGEQNNFPKTCFDPFGGVGTTALTCQDLGIKCFSIENSPFFFDVARAKLRSDYISNEFEALIEDFREYLSGCEHDHIHPDIETKTLFETQDKSRWIFNEPVANAILDIIVKIRELEINSSIYSNLFKLALGSQLVVVSNVFRNGKCLSYKKNWSNISITRKEVHQLFLSHCRDIILIDIRSKEQIKPIVHNYTNIMRGDSRELISEIPDNSLDLVITSPPYLNSRDYTDIYRLELWVLGYITRFEQEKKIRKSALTSHVQVKLAEKSHPQVNELEHFIDHLHSLNGNLWSKDIPNMVKGYFADMESIFIKMHSKLKKDAMVYINVSNSAYGNKICEVDTILARIAHQNGYKALEIRTARYINSSKQQSLPEKLRESIIVLKKD